MQKQPKRGVGRVDERSEIHQRRRSGQRGRSPVCPQNRAYGSVHGSSRKAYPPINVRCVRRSIGLVETCHSLCAGSSSICAGAVRPVSTSRPSVGSSYGLISPPRSFMFSDSAYVFRPSPPTSLSLTRWFTLGYVTATSSAPGFTITTASSAGPRPITCRVSAPLRA